MTLTASAGRVTAEIPDQAGEVHAYLAVRLAPWGEEDFALSLAREGGETHRVARGPLGWNCTCKDWEHRHRRHRRKDAGRYRGPCKHIEAALEILALIEALA